VASGRRRLVALLSTRDQLVELLQLFDATPARHGAERALAHELANWCSAYWPEIDWTVQPYGASGANVYARAGRGGRLLYSHLDTSLTGDSALDAAVTGRADPYPPLRVSAERVEGFGLGVARGPAAVALLGFVDAVERGGPATLLLAGSGTHRSALSGSVLAASGAGVSAYLDAAPAPPAAIVAKCGPPGVLWQEPGALYLRLIVTGRPGAVLAPASARPAGGVGGAAGLVLAGIERWRSGFIAARRGRAGQIGGEAGVGALSYGSAEKPDLFGAQLVADLYVVTVEGDDPDVLAGELAGAVSRAAAETPLAECEVAVVPEQLHPAAGTAADAAIVAQARTRWRQDLGREPAEIRDWTGSTDGVVLRGRGIDTVRLGPSSRTAADDPRCDSLDVGELLAFSRIYAALLAPSGPSTK
jgi:acetylornithine deacetylase/succinyl-diaminopimelate desuccinylase-like protein